VQPADDRPEALLDVLRTLTREEADTLFKTTLSRDLLECAVDQLEPREVWSLTMKLVDTYDDRKKRWVERDAQRDKAWDRLLQREVTS